MLRFLMDRIKGKKEPVGGYNLAISEESIEQFKRSNLANPHQILILPAGSGCCCGVCSRRLTDEELCTCTKMQVLGRN